MGHVEGKRVAAPAGKPGGKKVLVIVLCAVAALLVAGYLGLCAWAVGVWAAGLFPAGKVGEAATLALCALSGVAAYFLLARLLGLEEAKIAGALVLRRKRG